MTKEIISQNNNDPDEYQLYLSGLSIPEVSEKTDIAKSTLRFRFKKKGILRTRKEGIRQASKNGRLSNGLGKSRIFTEEWKKNISDSKLRISDSLSKGYSLKPNGYIEITRGKNKGKLLHRVIMSEVLGFKLKDTDVVHHKDHNRSNNNPDNLEIMTASEHASHHAKENLKNRERNNLGQFRGNK